MEETKHTGKYRTLPDYAELRSMGVEEQNIPILYRILKAQHDLGRVLQ